MNINEQIERAIAAITNAQQQNKRMQDRTKVGSAEWHEHESIDDKLHDALTALGG